MNYWTFLTRVSLFLNLFRKLLLNSPSFTYSVKQFHWTFINEPSLFIKSRRKNETFPRKLSTVLLHAPIYSKTDLAGWILSLTLLLFCNKRRRTLSRKSRLNRNPFPFSDIPWCYSSLKEVIMNSQSRLQKWKKDPLLHLNLLWLWVILSSCSLSPIYEL